MIGPNDLTAAASAATAASPGGASAPPAAPGAAQYLRGVHIDQEDEETGGATAPNLVNDRDTHPQIEFIHFGNVHTSYGNRFPHDNFKDNETAAPLAETARPRAIQFRSALEREAILLSVFIESAQTVLAERELSLGGLAGAVGSLLGGGGGGAVKSSALNAPLQKVITAAGTLNAASIQYHDTHKAGRDFHDARADYRKLLNQVVAEGATPSTVPNPAASLPATDPKMKALADLASFSAGVLFKSTDIKVKCFALLAAQQERQIELACHAMSLAAITTLINPFLPVWAPPPQPSKPAPAAPGSASPGQSTRDRLASQAGLLYSGDTSGIQNSIQNTVQSAVFGTSFFDVQGSPDAQGPEFIGMAFNVPDPSPNPADPVPMEFGRLLCQGFMKALGKAALPEFGEELVTGIDSLIDGFMQSVYAALVIRPADQSIDKEQLLLAARGMDLAATLKGLTINRLLAINASKYTSTVVMGQTVGPANLVGNEQAELGAKIDTAYDERVAPALDQAVRNAMGDLARQLELARQDAASTKSYTMEWYLGRLPWVRVALFHNLFHPFWSAMMRVVAEVMGGPVSAALKTMLDSSDKLKRATDAASAVGADASSLGDAASSLGQSASASVGAQTGSLDPGGAGRQAVDTGISQGFLPPLPNSLNAGEQARGMVTSNTITPTAAAAAIANKRLASMVPILRGKFKLPFTNRLADGQGMDITDYKEVQKNHQWDHAAVPPGE